jgi:hypothetical protein
VAGRLDEPRLSGTVLHMSPETFLAECENNDIEELAARLGGWEAVLAEWRSLGDRESQFADVWEMVDFLFEASSLLADRMGVDESVVVHFSSVVQVKLLVGDMGGAQDMLASFCGDTASAYEAFAAQDPADVEASQLGIFWRSWADGFISRAPRVAPTPIV